MSYDYISEKSCRSDKIKLMSVKQVALCSGMYLEFINLPKVFFAIEVNFKQVFSMHIITIKL